MIYAHIAKPDIEVVESKLFGLVLLKCLSLCFIWFLYP